MSIAQQDTPTPGRVDPPPSVRRGTRLDEESVLIVSVADRGAALHVSSPFMTTQTSVLMSREQLQQHRDAINAVLVATEPSA